MKKAQLALANLISLLLLIVIALQSFEVAKGNFMGPPRKFPAPIYIKEDGSVQGANGVVQQYGDIYILTQDTNKTIHILRDNILFDGNGFSLTAPSEANADDPTAVGGSDSIRIFSRSNVTIMNTKFIGCDRGIMTRSSSNITVIQNVFQNSGTDVIYMESCSNCSIIGNSIVDNSCTGLFIISSSYINIAYNNISRNHGHGAWMTVNYSNITKNNIVNNTELSGGIGIYMYRASSFNRIFENNFINNHDGLFYQGARNTSINNLVYSNYWNNSNRQIVNIAGDVNSGIDESPLTSPISNSFEPVVISLPSSSPTPTVAPFLTPPPNIIVVTPVPASTPSTLSPEPIPTQQPTPMIAPTSSPALNPSPSSPTSSIESTPSPTPTITQQPTSEPTQTTNPVSNNTHANNFIPLIILVAIVAVAAIVCAVVSATWFLRKRRT